ncbi:hypothetical protein [Actinopolymorpha rutila]|uniref:Uncharacterized protein n=1 Tax=Actinopolymorpha rutila TaxID=446787 RepID=A0A852ZA63_9ACTN|nr:hypothetical protein [Actinopolymorpha rutila]NYH90087.1 hypothetical protein [Actinopolymorpha rutila]
MRTEEEVSAELAEVRTRREEFFPTEGEPLAKGAPEPTEYWPGGPGGEITELLEREAKLVLERAEIRRAGSGSGETPPAETDEEEAAARRILRRIEDARKT